MAQLKVGHRLTTARIALSLAAGLKSSVCSAYARRLLASRRNDVPSRIGGSGTT